MINVIVYKDGKGLIEGFSLKGHAGYAEHGSDIVCSAVSMLTINTLNSISEFTSDAFTYQVQISRISSLVRATNSAL